MRLSSQRVRDADILVSHQVATVDASVIADELQVPISENDETDRHMKGSTLPDAVGRDHSPLPELPQSFRRSAPSRERIKPQGDHSQVLRTFQVPTEVPDKQFAEPEPCYRSVPVVE